MIETIESMPATYLLAFGFLAGALCAFGFALWCEDRELRRLARGRRARR